MAVRIKDGKKVVAEDQTFERAMMRLEIAHEGEWIMYPHVDGHEIHVRTWDDKEGRWSDDVKVLTVEADDEG